MLTCFYIYKYLSIERDGFRLTLGTNALGPGRVSGAARFDAAADVVQIGELAAVQATGQLAQVRLERHVLDLVLLQVGAVVRLQRQAAQARRFFVLSVKTSN